MLVAGVMHTTKKHEELIGVKLPGGDHHIITVRVGALETDEEILCRISTTVGTIYNVTGTKYKVVSSDPFKLKKISDKKLSDSDLKEEPEDSENETVSNDVSPDKAPQSQKIFTGNVGPVVGERWKPKDPRRKNSFLVSAIDGDSVVTDDGRRIQLSRFRRYVKIEE